MKRIAILLVLIFCTAFLIVSCSGETDGTTTETTAKEVETTAPTNNGTTDGVLTTTKPTDSTTAPETTKTITEATTASVTTPATTPAESTATETAPETTAAPLTLVKDNSPVFQVIAPADFMSNEVMTNCLYDISNAFVSLGVKKPTVAPDSMKEKTYEILVGQTNREIELPEIGQYEWLLTVKGTKVIILANNQQCYLEAVAYFIDTYVKDSTNNVTLPGDLCYIGKYDMYTSTTHNMTYADIATDVWTAFNDKYWKQVWIPGNWFWDTAETLEVYIDAYEQTKDEAIKDRMLKFADQFIRKYQKDWTWNEYNDDIMWICIAFSRITQLTGTQKYYEYAKTNFDATYARAYDESFLGGGMWWRIENNTKNSCVNCPGAIAACLIGEISGDESYFEKAKGLIDWELKYMYEKNTGKLYDSYNIKGEINKWASTYNQGTFIGACTLLYKHYQKQEYLDYAQKAAEYAMTKLVDKNGVVDNGETNGNDLPGFKGILTRWLYRYAKEVESTDILLFLQHNADVAYKNRNAEGLIWTAWKSKTPDDLSDYITFSMTTAVALVYNCQPWW